MKVPKCYLRDDLENLLKREQLWDVTISVGHHELHAHKAILAGQCSHVH